MTSVSFHNFIVFRYFYFNQYLTYIKDSTWFSILVISFLLQLHRNPVWSSYPTASSAFSNIIHLENFPNCSTSYIMQHRNNDVAWQEFYSQRHLSLKVYLYLSTQRIKTQMNNLQHLDRHQPVAMWWILQPMICGTNKYW